MKLSFADRPPLDAPALAVGLWEGRRPDHSFGAVDGDGRLSRAVAASRITGKEGEALTVFQGDRRIVVLGLGPQGMTADRAERIGAALAVELLPSGVETVSILSDLGEHAAHLGLGLRLRAWRADLRGRPDPDAPRLAAAVICGRADDRLQAVADAVLFCRDLVVAPANRLTPAAFAEKARSIAGLHVEVMDEGRLAREGLRLLAAVGQGSANPPRLVAARWRGAAATEKPWVFVGKGITFDTGGISIKHGDKVHEMKGDMAGAAAALGAVKALAATKAPVNAVAVLALAENMPSGRALRPGDVVESFSGRTVEIVDTDAEGRLVLADALAWACARLKPRAMIDLATLTGAIVTTLGHHHGGLFASGDELAERLLQAGQAVGEPLWRLPLSAVHDEALKSEIADVRNCAWGRVPDALHAARFLQGFVPDGLPWAHLDIAGVTEKDEDWALGPKGPTGFGVRLLERLIRE